MSQHDLTTADRAESWLRRQGIQLKGEDTDDMIIEILLSGASRAVQNEIGKNIRPREVDGTKRFRYDGSGVLSLNPHQLDSVTVVLLGSNLPVDAQRTLVAQSAGAEADYELEPVERNGLGCYDEIILPGLRERNYTRREYQVAITGTWGADDVPADIEWLVLEIVRLSYPTPSPIASVEDIGATFANLNWLPRQLMEVLDNYRDRPI